MSTPRRAHWVNLVLSMFCHNRLASALYLPNSKMAPIFKLIALFAVVLAFPTICHARSCPAVWTKVAADLKDTFAGCSSEARQAIRAAFHDCFTGACDGSLILANECLDREENLQIQPICDLLGQKAVEYNVGTADMIQAAACKHDMAPSTE